MTPWSLLQESSPRHVQVWTRRTRSRLRTGTNHPVQWTLSRLRAGAGSSPSSGQRYRWRSPVGAKGTKRFRLQTRNVALVAVAIAAVVWLWSGDDDESDPAKAPYVAEGRGPDASRGGPRGPQAVPYRHTDPQRWDRGYAPPLDRGRYPANPYADPAPPPYEYPYARRDPYDRAARRGPYGAYGRDAPYDPYAERAPYDPYTQPRSYGYYPRQDGGRRQPWPDARDPRGAFQFRPDGLADTDLRPLGPSYGRNDQVPFDGPYGYAIPPGYRFRPEEKPEAEAKRYSGYYPPDIPPPMGSPAPADTKAPSYRPPPPPWPPWEIPPYDGLEYYPEYFGPYTPDIQPDLYTGR